VARDPDSVRAAIGVTVQLTAVDNLLTAEEHLVLMASAPSCARARETTTGNALAGCPGSSSGQSPSTSRAVLQPVPRPLASSASRPRSRRAVTSRPW
jgi:hypothetical protein